MSVRTRERVDLSERDDGKVRNEIGDAVYFALDAGWNAEQVESEVQYAIDNYEPA